MYQAMSPGIGFPAIAPGLAGAEREAPNFSPKGLFLLRDPHRALLIYTDCCKYIWMNTHPWHLGGMGEVTIHRIIHTSLRQK